MLKTLGATMLARDWFEELRWKVTCIAKVEEVIKAMRLKVGAHGQKFDAIGKGGGSDVSDAAIAIAEAEIKLDEMRAKVEPEIETATAVLYGLSSRGGLAKRRCSADTDCILGYYVMGMSWHEVACEMVKPDSRDAEQWCKRRAYRALAALDEYDWRELINS